MKIRDQTSAAHERHYVSRAGWLRAAVLGANDGLLSTSSVVVGVAAASASASHILLTGVASLVAGSMAMAAGEYVSVSSQSDAEKSDLSREARELENDRDHEERELAAIYARRGVDDALALQVARQLMAKDALGAHARDELGIHETSTANPVQAAVASAISFAAGAFAPLLTTATVPHDMLIPSIFVSSILVLALLGAAGARAGGAPITRAVLRVVFWGAIAMGVTAGAGYVFNTSVA